MFLDIRLGRQDAHFATLDAEVLQKHSHPRRRPPDSGRLLKDRHRLLDRGDRMHAEVRFPARALRRPCALRRVAAQWLQAQAFDTARLLRTQIGPQGRLANPDQAPDVLMRQTLAFPIQGCHFSRHPRMGVMIALVTERVDSCRSKCYTDPRILPC